MPSTVNVLALRSFIRDSHPCRLPFQIPIYKQRALSYCVARSGIPSRSLYFCVWSTSSPPSISLSRSRLFTTPPTHPPKTLVDPSRPSLFYHFIPAPNPLSANIPVYGVSFLDRPPKRADSPVIMGWLPAVVSEEAGEAGLGDFKENGCFLDVLHQVIQKAIKNGTDEGLKAEAIQLNDGWMHVKDDRNLPPMGRISNPNDIIASVRVEGGKILSDTYSPMPTYRICTTDGLTTLSEGLERKLLERLRQIEF